MGLQRNRTPASEGILTRSFVQVWTLRRGALSKSEPLDMAGQLAAYSQALADAVNEAQMPVTRYSRRAAMTPQKQG